MSTILEVKGLTKKFGGVTAVGDLDMSVEESQIFGLIGPNGAGKTTVFSMISGFQRPTAGQILFEGTDVVGKPAHAVSKLGVARLVPALAAVRQHTRARERHRRLPPRAFLRALLQLPRDQEGPRGGGGLSQPRLSRFSTSSV